MDWPAYNTDCTRRHLRIAELDPDSHVRLDLLSDGWGCSIESEHLHPASTVGEVYGTGEHPAAAMDHAIRQLEPIVTARFN